VDRGDWLNVAQLDTLDEIRLFALWVSRIGSGERDRGEASVFAIAELHSATAITDDQEAVRVARTYGRMCTEPYGCLQAPPGTANYLNLPPGT
jgi:predicted nucleic acid-binding protein